VPRPDDVLLSKNVTQDVDHRVFGHALFSTSVPPLASGRQQLSGQAVGSKTFALAAAVLQESASLLYDNVRYEWLAAL
jgi:hypothetical protein